MSEAWKNRLWSLVIVCFLAITSCTTGQFSEKSFADVKRKFFIPIKGQPNNNFIDALDVWGAESFGDWNNHVKQTVIVERGIFVFRYRTNYHLPGGNACGIKVSVTVAKKNDKMLKVKFSNIVRDGSLCTWINEEGVEELNANFHSVLNSMREAIEEFHREYQ